MLIGVLSFPAERRSGRQMLELALDCAIVSVGGSAVFVYLDAPVSKFVLTMQGGRKGLVVDSRNLCAAKNRADAVFSGQNGRLRELRPAVRPSCGGKRRAARKRR